MDLIPTRASMRLKFGLVALFASIVVLSLFLVVLRGDGVYWFGVVAGCVAAAGFLATALLDRRYLKLVVQRASLGP